MVASRVFITKNEAVESKKAENESFWNSWFSSPGSNIRDCVLHFQVFIVAENPMLEMSPPKKSVAAVTVLNGKKSAAVTLSPDE